MLPVDGTHTFKTKKLAKRGLSSPKVHFAIELVVERQLPLHPNRVSGTVDQWGFISPRDVGKQTSKDGRFLIAPRGAQN